MIFLFSIKKWFKTTYDLLYFKDYIVFNFKSLEIEIFKGSDYLLRFELDFSLKGKDHAGIKFSIDLIGFGININFYDHRHWDYKNNTWIYEYPYDY
jgi:hypothetical protein